MKWKALPMQHKGENRIAIYFESNDTLNTRVRQLPGVKWSKTHGAWHVEDNKENRIRFKLNVENSIETFNKQVPQPREVYLPTIEAIEKLEKFKQWLRSRKYSENTVKTYTEALQVFLKFYEEKPVAEITNEDIIIFNNQFIFKNQLSASYQNQIVNSIKLFFAKVQDTKLNLDLVHRPKRMKQLPNVLSKEEIKQILNAHSNLKHKAMLSLIYSCGLRRSELINLKITDIDSRRGVIVIRQSKGKKDRIAPLSEKIILILREYFKAFKPKNWLFEGQIANEQYDVRSLSNVLKQALDKCKITKPVSLHWLRHSYATHLLESGTDLRFIQEILGHTSSRTTEIYTHVSTKSLQKIKSPFDDL